MTATGLGFTVCAPALGRLAHLRAILAARLWMEASPTWRDGRPWLHSERRLRAEQPAAGRAGHIPDAEIHWPSIDGSPYAGQVWAVKVELTPKSIGRTTRIMTGLLSPMQYALVVYLTRRALLLLALFARLHRLAHRLPSTDHPRTGIPLCHSRRSLITRLVAIGVVEPCSFEVLH